MRNLKINDQNWTYSIGIKFAVIKSPTNKRINVELSKIKGVPQEQIDNGRKVFTCEEGCDIGDFDPIDNPFQEQRLGMVTPSEIKQFILDNPSLWS